MNKTITLLRATITQDMGLFKIKSKSTNAKTKFIIPLVLTAVVMFYMGSSAFTFIEQFKESHMEHLALAIFILLFSIITLFEGFYKASSLLFNCKDDQLLLSLPISRKTVLFIRMFKFYLFELLFNSLFILPVMVVYGLIMNSGALYYFVCAIALLLIPIIPIVLSSIIGYFTTYISSKFKGKNIAQSVITMALALVTLVICFGFEGILNMMIQNASQFLKYICYYYPVGAFIKLITDFDILTFILFIVIHLGIFALSLIILGKYYFKLNSKMKSVTVVHNNKPYVVKTRSKLNSFIKKEFSRFVQTPVFIVNAGFGLVMFVAACVALCFKYNDTIASLTEKFENIDPSMMLSYLPIGILALVVFSAYMTSITSSMISLEGKSLNILKSLPIKSSMIVLYKVITSLVIIVPCLLLGDILVFIFFKFSLIDMLLILYASILIPFIAELIGIMVNLRFPKMDATNDTEIVKQSMSSFISVFAGMGLAMVSSAYLLGLTFSGVNTTAVAISFLIISTILAVALWLRLVNTADKRFNEIQV